MRSILIPLVSYEMLFNMSVYTNYECLYYSLVIMNVYDNIITNIEFFPVFRLAFYRFFTQEMTIVKCLRYFCN